MLDRALLPDLIKFAYIPRAEFVINANGPAPDASAERLLRARDADFELPVHNSGLTMAESVDREEEHILVLDFIGLCFLLCYC